MRPEEAAGRVAAALLVGMGLGGVYGFLRPLRPRFTVAADGIFLMAAVAGWLILWLKIGGGELRAGEAAAVILGGWFWEKTGGKSLAGVYRGFWRGIRKIISLFCAPFKKIFAFFRKILKKIFASGKKSGTIEDR